MVVFYVFVFEAYASCLFLMFSRYCAISLGRDLFQYTRNFCFFM